MRVTEAQLTEALGSDALFALADALRAAGYSTRAAAQALEHEGPPETLLTRTAWYSFVAPDLEPAEASANKVLTWLFLLSKELPSALVETALPAQLHAQLRRLHWLVDDGARARATLSLVELDGRYFVADPLFDFREGELRMRDEPDAVMPVHESSLYLLRNFDAPPSGRRFLDVGTGCGCLALLAPTGNDQRVGIDLNARATLVAQVNAALNAIDARFLTANCLTFGGSSFDHVVFNSPTRPNYRRDSKSLANFSTGLGHEFIFTFVRERLPTLLAPGGVCQIWGLLAVPGPRPVQEWLGDTLALDGLQIDLRIARKSAFHLSREDVQRGRIPRGSYLLEAPGDAAALIAFLREHDVREVLPSLLTLRQMPGRGGRVDVSHLD